MTPEPTTLIEPSKHKRTTFGTGLIKGLGITLRHLLTPTVTIQYPHVQDPLPSRSRGVIALKTENCTVCMLCARECPDWCIYIEGHKETRQPVAEGKRAKKFNVLDRFAIDYALCMYCGICVEVCPYDALFWSPEFEYAEHDITQLTHEMERLNEWMYSVRPPEALEEGAMGPELKTAVAADPSAPKTATPVATVPQAPKTATGQGPAADEVSGAGESPSGLAATGPATETSSAAAGGPTADSSGQEDPDASRGAGRAPASEAGGTPAAVDASRSAGRAPAEEAAGSPDAGLVQGVSDEEAGKVRQEVYEAEMAKGSDPRIAEARAKAAEMRARKGTKGPGT